MGRHIHYKGRQEVLSMSETVRPQGDKPWGTTDTIAQKTEERQKYKFKPKHALIWLSRLVGFGRLPGRICFILRNNECLLSLPTCLQWGVGHRKDWAAFNCCSSIRISWKKVWAECREQHIRTLLWRPGNPTKETLTCFPFSQPKA